MSDATTYTIQVYNESDEPQNYLLFQTVPVPSGQPNVFANVYQSSGLIESGNYSQATFQMTNEFYAVLGTAPTPLGDHVKVSTGAAEPVTLSSGNAGSDPGTTCVLSTTDGLYPKWGDVTQSQNVEPNAFCISCDGTFEYPTQSKSPCRFLCEQAVQLITGIQPIFLLAWGLRIPSARASLR